MKCIDDNHQFGSFFYYIKFRRWCTIDHRIADLLLVRDTNLISRVIEDITHSPYSHIAGYVNPTEIVEAQGWRKVGYQDAHRYDGISDAYTCDTLTDAQRIRIAEYVTRELGYRYDYILVGVEFVRYTLHITLPYREPFHARICSTLWSDAFRSVGVDLCPGIRYPSPADLAESKSLRKVESI